LIGDWRKVHNEDLHNLCPSSLLGSINEDHEMGVACRLHERRTKF